MNTTHWLTVCLALSLCGCDSVLDLDPVDEIPEGEAITDANGARAALIGAYDAVQSLSYYGGDYVFFNDMSADNAIHTGTFQSFTDADANALRADNATIEGIWDALYVAINRVNHILDKVPAVPDLDPAESDQILGEAHFLRALHYHNLVRLWGDVPIRTTPITSVDEASQITRSPVTDVYAQILADLQAADGLITSTTQTRRASLGAVYALYARVHLYRGDWVNAAAAADDVEALGYTLAANYADLFTGEGDDTSEDIFRVSFSGQDFNNLGWYYTSAAADGRGEVGLDPDLTAAFDTLDDRLAWSISADSTYPSKFPTTIGAEHPHVIRLAEVILTRAEALAQQNLLLEAVTEYNRIRARAGLADHVLGVDVTTQAEVLAAIWNERRLELAFEGDRWADLVRTGRAESVLGIPSTQTLYPIPQGEIDVAPGLEQNPGY